ncbi:MAG: histidine phosphatase family protein [Crocinitomix sp.]|nr:histidine phosphatase family protein [Crocinitomix sp.]
MINFSIHITGICNLGLVKIEKKLKFMLNLYVIRHGKAVRPEDAVNDFNRELNKKGTAQTNQVGDLLKRADVKIDLIVTSGAKRTAETAEIINFHLNAKAVYYTDDLYLADRKKIQKIISKHGKGDNVLLVGHNNGLSDFVSYLSGKNLVLSTSMLVHLSFDLKDWSEIDANLAKIELIFEPNVHSF